MSDQPSVRKDLHDIIHKIGRQDPGLLTKVARLRGEQIMDELCAGNPKLAAMEAERKADMQRWKQKRAKLAEEIHGETTSFWIATLSADPAAQEAAGLVLRLTDYLWDMDAPAQLIHDLLRIGKRLLPE